MYGREQQLRLLIESFQNVQLSGSSKVCIVSGHSGSGKTFLVRKALDRMTQEGALTAYAKYDQFNEDVPYTAMVSKYLVFSLILGSMHL